MSGQRIISHIVRLSRQFVPRCGLPASVPQRVSVMGSLARTVTIDRSTVAFLLWSSFSNLHKNHNAAFYLCAVCCCKWRPHWHAVNLVFVTHHHHRYLNVGIKQALGSSTCDCRPALKHASIANAKKAIHRTSKETCNCT